VWGVGGDEQSHGNTLHDHPSLYLRVHDSTIHGYPPTGNYIDGRRENSEPVPLHLAIRVSGYLTWWGLVTPSGIRVYKVIETRTNRDFSALIYFQSNSG